MNDQLQYLARRFGPTTLSWEGFQWKCECEMDNDSIRTRVQYFSVEPEEAVGMVHYLVGLVCKEGVDAATKQLKRNEITF